MSLLKKVKTTLREYPLFKRVVSSSLHLFSSNTISLVLSVLQGWLIFHLLGVGERGLFRVVMTYAATINSLLSFRMSEIVVRYGGEYIEKGEKNKASALIRAAGWTEAIVSILAFVVVLFTAGWASEHIAHTPEIKSLFIIFAIGLLANFNTETSTGILQITGKIKLQGTINLIQSFITFLIIAYAGFSKSSLEIILFAYLLGKCILGLGMFLIAQVHLHRAIGKIERGVPISTLTSVREIIRFAVSSNISATIIKIFRESEILWVSFLISPVAAGYYDAAYTIVGFLSIPIDPLIVTTYPEINSLVVQKAWQRLKAFLRKITSLAFLYNIALAFGLVVLGRWVISIYSGEEYLPAYPAMLALLIGLAFNYTLFWNRPLLLSLGLPVFPIRVTLIVGLIKIALALFLVPRYGFVAAGALLSFYYIASVGVMAWRGVREISYQENLNREVR